MRKTTTKHFQHSMECLWKSLFAFFKPIPIKEIRLKNVHHFKSFTMKNNGYLKIASATFLKLLFVCFLMQYATDAHAVISKAGFTATYDSTKGEVYIEFPVYFHDSNDEDHVVNLELYFKDANGNWVKFAERTGNKSWDDCEEPTFSGTNNFTVSYDYDPNCSNSGTYFAEVTLKDLPSDVLALGQVEFSADAHVYKDGNDVFWNVGGNDMIRSVSIDVPPQLDNLTATTDNCNKIVLDWSDPGTVPSGIQDKAKIVIYEEGTIKFQKSYISNGIPVTTHDVTQNLTPGTEYEYKVGIRYQYANNYVDGSLTAIATGVRKDTPDPPTNFTATDDNCDATIDLEWDWQTSPNPDSFRIVRSGTLIAVLAGSVRNYTDEDEDITRGQVYTYNIRAKNDCGWSSEFSSDTGESPLGPAKPADLNAQVIAGTGVRLTWPATVRVTKFEIERSLLGGGGSSFFEVDKDSLGYLDTSLKQCQTYEYRIRAINDCEPDGVLSDSIASIKLIPDLSSTFDASESLLASKGFFSDRVEISWSELNPNSFINAYKIYRKQLGTDDDSTVVETLNASSNFFIDNYTDAGVLYEYFIVAESQCENSTITSNVASAIGFRSPFGTVTGNVSYGGGVAVEGARISAESTADIFGKSVFLDGTSRLTIEDASTLDVTDELLLEAWVRPESYDNEFFVIMKDQSYRLRYWDTMYQFTIWKDSVNIVSVFMPSSELPLNNYSHIAAQVVNDSMHLYVNGVKKASQSTSSVFPNGVDINESGIPVVIGLNLTGYMDEVRIWNKAKSENDIKNDYSRLMIGSEAGLAVYSRMNEGAGLNTYDISRSGTFFNRNHAAFIGNVQWSDTIPTISQLGLAAYTDSLGNYVLTAPYHGGGEVFKLSPSYLTHEFDPSSAALFIGDGASVHAGVDFLDKSSFTVTGSLNFKNTTCGVKDAYLKVDGEIVIESGLPVQTNAEGLFEIQVPIGEHIIEVEQQGHVYSVGRFPATGTYNFQEPLAGINFTDSTLVTVVGRVVGGTREGNKIPGLGKSKNNIGQAEIKLTSQGSGCSTHTVTTDAATGEYSVSVPPLKYVPSLTLVSYPFNTEFNDYFEVLDLVDLSGTPTLATEYDTLFDAGGNMVSIDSIQYHEQLDYIYRVNPEIAVFDKDGVSPFIGDSTYTYMDPSTGLEAERDLRSNPLRWPVLHQQDDDYLYRCMIRVFELYTNKDNDPIILTDSVPTTDGTLHFNNELSHIPNVQIDLKDVNNADTLKSLVYSFKPGFPNFTENLSIPEYSYTQKFELNLITSSGMAIPWEPVTNVPQGGDAIFRAYMLGTRSNGEQFFTEGPQVPEYILRDPPGSGSSASREAGTTKSELTNWNWNLGSEVSTSDEISLGAKFSIGFGVQTQTEIENNINFGLSAEISGGNEGSQSVTTTNTKTWSTFDGTDIAPGASSDLYIAKSKNIQYGIAEELAIIPNILLDSMEALGGNDAAGSGFSFGKKYGVSIVPKGYSTHIMVQEYDIKNLLLPNLVSLRNALLQSNPKYTNVLPVSDPNYGKNNDDPAFGNSATPNPESREFADLSGPSYTYNAISYSDSTSGDSVRYINEQIEQWEEAIRLNEWEKVNIGNQAVIDSLEQVELDKLEEEYTDIIDRYASVVGPTVVGQILTYSAIASPLPGTAIAGYATFAITTGGSIAIAELAEEYETYLAEKDRINDKFNAMGTPVNYTVTGGTTLEESITHESASSYTQSVEYGLSADFTLETSGKISNTGVGTEKGIAFEFSSGRDWGTETTETETVSYSLNANIGDILSVDVFPSMLGWGPIFKTKAGSATSCPHEEAIVTEYYEPGTEISPATLQIEKPAISASPSILTNIPADEAAVFNLTLGNESEVAYTQAYDLRVISASNPFGAIVRFDGVFDQSVEVPGGSSVNKVLTIEKGPGSVYEYDSILVVFTSQCQYTAGTGFNTDIADSVYLTAHFLPSCTDVSLATPEDNWVLNNSFNDTMPVAIIDYNINFADLESIRVDYKPASDPNWVGLQTFLKDTSGLNDPSLVPIPTSAPFTFYDWDVSQLTDGDYDLRVVSNCLFTDEASVTHSGTIDRINPHPFGNPSPADGILSPNDEISIKFNEPIDLGSINQTFNFDIRGVLNGTETDHSTSLYFDGVDDYMIVEGGVPLQNRDFTIEFSVKRNSTGEEAIISQGTDTNERLFIGFDANDHFVFRINDQEVASTATFTDTDWHLFAVSYDHENETAELFLADEVTTSTVLNTGNTTIFPDYVGAGELFIGINSVNNSDYFTGNLHELRVWNTARTLSEFSVYKTLLLSGSELGLLYNWRMDEADGDLAGEHIRRRDAVIVGPTWEITPNGHAVSFDGSDDYLKIFTDDVNITEGMDFTLEFWFNSLQPGAATLFSNGTGTGLGADSLLSWNIDKDANGLIHIKHYGIDFVATNEDFFDGGWHHFSMVFQRSGNLSVYVDGNLQNATQALAFQQLGGSHMYLGARGFKTGTVETVENHFDGEMDEFRFWNTARKVAQVTRDKQHRMSGDELGLNVYMPFENYSLDPTGIPILTASFDEQIDAQHVVENPNGATLISQTPTIKLQRPVQAIAFTFSVNNDEIILTPTTSQEIIENVTLDVTVEGIKDLHGNVMESPATWIAYMDKNQVIWQDDLISFDMMRGEELSFTSGILNQGGAAKVFEILDMPEWLTVAPESGVIDPNSSKAVFFEIDPDISIGNYTVDLSLLTDFGYPERLTIELRVRGEEPDWSVNPADFDHSMGIIGQLKINNVISADDEDMLMVRVGTEVRGVAHLEYVPQLDQYLTFLDIYSDVTSGDSLEFWIWDASSGTVFSDVNPKNLTFVNDTLIGSALSPQVFETTNEVSLEVDLNTGWNWISFPLEWHDSTNIDDVLGSFEHTNGDQIKGHEVYGNYNGGSGQWNGTIDNNGEGVQPEQLYKLYTALPGILIQRGTIINPVSRTINLKNGWTWIGFISVRNQPIEQALGNLNANAGDIIKGKTQFATYDPVLGWIGSLKTMKPGEGFMYKSDGTNSFTYPVAGMFNNFSPGPEDTQEVLLSGSGSESGLYTNVLDHWTTKHSTYNTNMTMFSELVTDCGEILSSGKYAIGIFDRLGISRAFAPIEKLDGQEVSYLTIAGEFGDQLNVFLLDNESGAEIDLGHSMTYAANDHIGNVDDPFLIEVSEEVCLQLKSGDPIDGDAFTVFPTVFSETFSVDYLADQKDEQARISVTNVWGQVIFTTEFTLEEGQNRQQIDLSGYNLTNGLYTVELLTNGQKESMKVIRSN